MYFFLERYAKTTCFTFIANIVVLALGITIYCLDLGTYGETIYNETQQWNHGVVSDILTVSYDSSCPSDYIELTGFYLGTHDVCIKNNNYYTLGPCKGKRNYGTTRIGVSDETLTSFNGSTICYLIDNATNYHSIAASRVNMALINSTTENGGVVTSYCNDSTVYCGPPNPNIDYDYAYCMSN